MPFFLFFFSLSSFCFPSRQPNLVVVNYEILHRLLPALEQLQPTAVVFDESQYGACVMCGNAAGLGQHW